jgi:hypothetical protein
MTIQINKVATNKGVQWMSEAWGLFKEQSGLWMKSIFFIIMLGIAVQFMGEASIFFVVLYSLAHPFLMAGLYHMVFKAKNGINSQFGDLFIAFKDIRARKVLLQVAIASIIMSLLASLVMSDVLTDYQAGTPLSLDLIIPAVVVYFTYLMFFAYAVPIAYFFHEQNLLMILKTSFKACWQNIWPLMVLSICGFCLCFFAAAVTMGLGFFIVFPWLYIAFYLSFNDLLGGDLHLDEDLDINGDNNDQNDDQNDDQSNDVTFTV